MFEVKDCTGRIVARYHEPGDCTACDDQTCSNGDVCDPCVARGCTPERNCGFVRCDARQAAREAQKAAHAPTSCRCGWPSSIENTPKGEHAAYCSNAKPPEPGKPTLDLIEHRDRTDWLRLLHPLARLLLPPRAFRNWCLWRAARMEPSRNYGTHSRGPG